MRRDTRAHRLPLRHAESVEIDASNPAARIVIAAADNLDPHIRADVRKARVFVLGATRNLVRDEVQVIAGETVGPAGAARIIGTAQPIAMLLRRWHPACGDESANHEQAASRCTMRRRCSRIRCFETSATPDKGPVHVYSEAARNQSGSEVVR